MTASELFPHSTLLLCLSLIVEGWCHLSIIACILISTRRRPVAGLAWMLTYLATCAAQKILTSVSVWSPARWRQLQAALHLVLGVLSVLATHYVIRFTRDRRKLDRIEDALLLVRRCESAEELLANEVEEPAAALGDRGAVIACNQALEQLLGVSFADVAGYGWIDHVHGYEKQRLLANWVGFAQGAIDPFIEEVTWYRPGGQRLQIRTRGRTVGTHKVVWITAVATELGGA